MSAPDPNKWALTGDEAEEIASAVDMYGPDSPEFLGGFAMIARRRAIEELRVIAEAWGPDCDEGKELLRRIAAIEAEEA